MKINEDEIYVILFPEFNYFNYYFNGTNIDIKLLYLLAPAIHINANLHFYNINALKEESIDVFEQIIEDYSLDIDQLAERHQSIWLYPASYVSNGYYNWKKFEDINMVLKFIKRLGSLFPKESTAVYIYNGIIEDTEILYLGEKLLGRGLAIYDSQINITGEDIYAKGFLQQGAFGPCNFGGVYEIEVHQKFAFKIKNRQQGLLSLDNFMNVNVNKVFSYLENLWIYGK